METSRSSILVGQQEYDNNDTQLWIAVMERAIRDLVALERFRQDDPQILEDPIFRNDYRSLKKWFYSSNMETGAFHWICSLVNIDPGWALTRLDERLELGLKDKAKQKAKTKESTKFVDAPNAIAA
ncbi:MAG: hypothetical protein HQL69_02695 [Magnetococcales bacterium]|nr:hypothetical protein [Magnetococcales bacterium]